MTSDFEIIGLEALASNLAISMRALINCYPELRRDEHPYDPPESRTAARLVDLHSQLLCAIDRHCQVLKGEPPDPPDEELPF